MYPVGEGRDEVCIYDGLVTCKSSSGGAVDSYRLR